MPPMSGLVASSLDSPLDENDVSCQRLATKIFVITTCCGTFPAAISFRIAAPARLEINAEGMKSEPNIYFACYHRWSRADSAQTLRQINVLPHRDRKLQFAPLPAQIEALSCQLRAPDSLHSRHPSSWTSLAIALRSTQRQ